MQMTYSIKTCTVALGLLLLPLIGQADFLDKQHLDWNTSVRIEGASNTLPVMALGKPSWPGLYSPRDEHAHAWQSMRFDLGLSTRDGWQVGYLARYEASLHANSDTVDIAALIEKGQDPSGARKFNVDLNSKTWSGQGLSVETPWLKLSTHDNIKYRAQWQLLSLERLNTRTASGWIDYTADKAYEFNVGSDHNSNKKTSQFSQAPDARGWGTSLSLSLRYDYDSASHIAFQGQDLLSQLNWRLLNEQANLNSRQKITFTDGSVDFTPMVSGRYQNITVKEKIDPDIRLRWARSVATDTKTFGNGQAVFDYRSRSNVSQYWVGWATINFHDIGFSNKTPQYKVSADALQKALRFELRYDKSFLVVGGDRFGQDAKQKIFQLGWRTNF
jgi:hypothetical protein